MPRILIVDDNAYFARLMANLLLRFGHEVHILETGEFLLELIKTDRYDLVIMELLLEGQDGLNLLRMIRCSPVSALKVIIVSHRTGYYEQLQATEYDAHFLSKPVDLNELLENVHKALENNSMGVV